MNPSDEQPPFFVNLHDVETRFSPMSPPSEEDAEESEKATKEVNAEPVYCVCKSTNDQGFMIECDACKDWFHGRCVNMSEKKSRSLKTWLCPSCCPQPESSLHVDTSKRSRRQSTPTSTAVSTPLTTALDSPTIDTVRSRVIEGFKQILTKGLQTLQEMDPQWTPIAPIEHLSFQIEQAMLESYGESHSGPTKSCGSAYKSQYRMLYANLKHADNIRRVLLGQLQPERLVLMTSDDLASDDLKHIKQSVKEESMRGSVLTEAQAAVILKKTVEVQGAGGIVESPLGTSTESLLFEEPQETSTDLRASSDLSKNHPTTTTFSSGSSRDSLNNKSKDDLVSSEPPSLVTDLDELLARVDSGADMVRLAPRKKVKRHQDEAEAPDDEKTPPPQEEEEKKAEPKDSKLSKEEVRRSPVIWKGKIEMLGVGSLETEARQVGGPVIASPLDWESLMPVHLQVDGRIQMDVVHRYLNDLTRSQSREILLIELKPTTEAEENLFFDYFHQRQRYAVVAHRMMALKDLYLMPLARDQVMPEFMFSLCHDLQMKRDRDVFLGVLVASRAVVQSLSGGASGGNALGSGGNPHPSLNLANAQHQNQMVHSHLNNNNNSNNNNSNNNNSHPHHPLGGIGGGIEANLPMAAPPVDIPVDVSHLLNSLQHTGFIPPPNPAAYPPPPPPQLWQGGYPPAPVPVQYPQVQQHFGQSRESRPEGRSSGRTYRRPSPQRRQDPRRSRDHRNR